MTKSVVLADPRGFCAGVDRAILTVQTILKAAEASGKRTREDGLPPVYVRRQIVHNKHVVEDLAGQGAVFGDSGCCCPSGYSGGVFRPWRISGSEGGSRTSWHACGGCHLPSGG